MESGPGHTSRRGCGIQCARKGHPHCAQSCSEIRRRVSDTWRSLQVLFRDILTGIRSAPLQLLTKGDNNAAADTELYAQGQDFLDRSKDVVGSVVGFVPSVGYVTILLSEYPWLKTAMLVFMALTVVLQRE